VDDGRLQLSQQSPELAVQAEVVSRALVQRVNVDVSAFHPCTELGVVRETNDHVAISLGRHRVNEVDETVLQPSDRKSMDDVRD
jgi:hypothetical protein